MIATHNQQAQTETLALNPTHESTPSSIDHALDHLKPSSAQIFLPGRIVTHHPQAGLNPLVDLAGYLFSILGQLKQLKSYRSLAKLQNELIQEITTFQNTVKNQGYNAEYLMVCRYILCATFDDLIGNTTWGGQGQWETYSLLSAFNQDTQHQDKFFTIMERALKEPGLYIDLMELMYICLSMGYKGQYRATEHNHYQLEQITNNLYKHIRAYRGSFSKSLSPKSFKAMKSTVRITSQPFSPLFILFLTACTIMTIFISLGYLMDVISNEAYKRIAQIETPVVIDTSKE